MLTTPHLLVGAAIGAHLPHAWEVVPLSAASHFILDSVPHIQGYIEVEDLEKREIVFLAADVLIGVGMVAFIALRSQNAEMVWVGALAAILPDFHHIAQVIFGPNSLRRYNSLHLKFHWKRDMKILPGVATQAITILAAILVALWHP